MVYNIIRKKLLQRRFLVSFPKFLKTYFVKHIRVDVWMKWTKKKLCLIYSQENNDKDFLFSAVADMWAYSFSKTHSIPDAFLWKLWSFTEVSEKTALKRPSLIRVKSHGFYRSLLQSNFISFSLRKTFSVNLLLKSDFKRCLG